MNKPTITLTIGASGSGKTTWAENFASDCTILGKEEIIWINNNVNRDEVRFDLFNNGVRDWTKYSFSKENEKKVTEVIEEKVKLLAEGREDIIISDTNLSTKTRDKWEKWASDNGYVYLEKLFPCSWNTLRKRAAQREGGLTEDILWRQYVQYMQQFGKYNEHKVEVYEPNNGFDTILVDLDALMEKDSYFFENLIYGEAHTLGLVTFLTKDFTVKKAEYIENIMASGSNATYTVYEYNSNYPEDFYSSLVENNILDNYNITAVLSGYNGLFEVARVIELPNIVNIGY